MYKRGLYRNSSFQGHFQDRYQRGILCHVSYYKMLNEVHKRTNSKKMKNKLSLIVSFFTIITLFTLTSCNSITKKIQGEWILTDVIVDGETITPSFSNMKIYFIGDTIEIYDYGYYIDTVKIKIDGNKIHYRDSTGEYSVMFIASVKRDKLTIEGTSGTAESHTVVNHFERPKKLTTFTNEKAYSPQKHKKKILGEWKFILTKSTRYYSKGEWEDNCEPVGWIMAFSKDGTGYQIRDNSRVVTFNWTIPSDGRTIILTNSKYDNEVIKIKSITKHTMHLISEDEEMKLIRVD